MIVKIEIKTVHLQAKGVPRDWERGTEPNLFSDIWKKLILWTVWLWTSGFQN